MIKIPFTKMNTNTLIGILYSIFYAIVCAGTLIAVEAISQSISSMSTLWGSAVFATVVLHIRSIKALRKVYRSAINHYPLVIVMILSVFFIVFSSYYSVAIIGVENYLVLYFSTLGMIATILHYVKIKQKKCIFSIIFYITAILAALSNLHLSNTETISSLISILLGCFGGVMYAKYSQMLYAATGLGALQLLSIRYWLVILVLPLFPHTIGHLRDLMIEYWAYIALMGVSVLILPLYLSQKSLEFVDYKIYLIISSTTPIFSLLLLYFILHDNRITFSIIMSCTFLFFATLITLLQFD